MKAPVPNYPFTVSADIDLDARLTVPTVPGDADVVVREGPVPSTLGDNDAEFGFEIGVGEVLLRVPDGSALHIREGREIIYRRGPETTDRDLSLFIHGTAWGVLCYQRGLIVIHASGNIVDGQITAFSGFSGSGKSTFAANLALKGFPFFTDDTLVFDPSGPADRVICHAGQRRMKLWKDAIERTGTKPIERVRDAGDIDKHFVAPPLAEPEFSATLARLVVLHRARGNATTDNALERLRGPEALQALTSNLYRPQFAEEILGKKVLYSALKQLLEQVQIFRFTRLMTPENYEASFDYFIDELVCEEAASE
ncbi:hypothetical protein [Aurantiacibacter sp. MUD61]|uniref:hypothetical protein n=1 Tax=Aurantiacibacter sp. MUD61 TaxID=3009083 RepID=UPI0022F0791B|nr:hypothetical protein [Aurantiacibacter sp. MUD61]